MKFIPMVLTFVGAGALGLGAFMFMQSYASASQGKPVQTYTQPTPTSEPVSKQSAPTATLQAPKSPTGIRIAKVGATSVTVAWNDSVMDRTTYVVYRTDVPNFVNPKQLGTNPGTSFTDNTVQPGMTYYYWVAATNEAGTSRPMSYAKVTTSQSWTEIHRTYENSVVKILTYTSPLGVAGSYEEGTGWFVRGGYIVTNWHVIRDAHYVVDVYLYDGEKIHAKIVTVDEKHDLALLKLQNGYSAPAIPLATARASAGEPVASLGHPGGEALTMANGVVKQTGVLEKVNGVGVLGDMTQTDIPTVGGSSGSPVFGPTGKVVGVIESAGTNNGDVSYFVPVDYVNEILSHVGQ